MKIKKYKIMVICLLVFPISWSLYSCGNEGNLGSFSTDIERVIIIVNNDDSDSGEIEILINTIPLTYPLFSDYVYTLKLKCADLVSWKRIVYKDGTIFENNTNHAIRGIDYECGDILTFMVNKNQPTLIVTK